MPCYNNREPKRDHNFDNHPGEKFLPQPPAAKDGKACDVSAPSPHPIWFEGQRMHAGDGLRVRDLVFD